MSKGDGRRPRGPDVSKEQYDKNFESIFGGPDNHEQEKSIQDQPTCKGGSRRTTESPTPCDEDNDREGSRHSGGEAQEFGDSGGPR